MKPAANMHFEKLGKIRHLRIRSAQDLRSVLALDEALWVATNAPIATIHGDPTFLQSMDLDRNGRITTHDLQSAIRWTLNLLAETGALEAGVDRLRAQDLSENSPMAERIARGVALVADRRGVEASEPICLADVREVLKQEQALPVSESGVALPSASNDPEIRSFIRDVVAVTGGIEHPTGDRGINQPLLESFLQAGRSWLDWLQAGQIEPGRKSRIMPLGPETPQVYEICSRLASKLDPYFAQCEVLALDEQFQRRMGLTEAELDAYDFDDPSAIKQVLAAAPIARPRPDRTLPLQEGVNPYYTADLEQLRTVVLPAVLDESPDVLSAGQWLEVKAFFEAHRQWCQSRPGGGISQLSAQKVREILQGSLAQKTSELISESVQRAAVLEDLRLTEKLLLNLRYLVELANNLVSFPHLYDPHKRAMLQMGTLVIDGRRLNLAVRVLDRAEHIRVAQTSFMYVLYAQIQCPDEKEPYEVALPVTAGNKGNLCVGKRGVFFDVNGKECDARIVHILEHPISVREALGSPFRRVSQMIVGKIEAITGQAEKNFEARSSGALDQVPGGTQAPGGAPAPPATPPPTQTQMPSTGMLVGGGLAIAAVTSAIAYISNTLASINYQYILWVLVTALALVLLPIAALALLKLRKRDLSAILEGSGWGINARMHLTFSQKRYFTQKPRHVSLIRRLKWLLILAGVVVLVAAALAVWFWR